MRIRTVAVLFAVMSFLPMQATAQPLRTYCDSPGMSWCFDVNSFDFFSNYVSGFGVTPHTTFSWFLHGSWSGTEMEMWQSFPNANHDAAGIDISVHSFQWNAMVRVYTEDGEFGRSNGGYVDGGGVVRTKAPFTPGQETVIASQPGQAVGGRLARVSTIDDIDLIGAEFSYIWDQPGSDPSERTLRFSCSPADGTCYDPAAAVVPEPMTVVLLGTGLLGIGMVGLRRRRKNGVEA